MDEPRTRSRADTPRPVAGGRPDPRIPPAREERERLRELARRRVSDHRLVPPLSIEELSRHARSILVREGGPAAYTDFLMVLLSNELWRDTLASVPHERRLVLLPRCLRDPDRCRAETDDLGLLCRQCGACEVGALQAEAESLGCVVLVAEGTTVVTRLIESGQADAVIGVSCLSVLERAFPHLAAEAVPGIAIPLLRDGCDRTAVDADWVREAIRLRSGEAWIGRPDLDRLRDEVSSWFETRALAEAIGERTAVHRLAIEWLARGGKRWRPVAAAGVFQALRGSAGTCPPEFRPIAVAVECFHKASLIHDDIEDGDERRYGARTLHAEHGVAVALNVGDFLLGEGYRLLAGAPGPADRVARMVAIAAEGHRTLCLGQGEELDWMQNPRPLRPEEAIAVFRGKTSPAFEVALRLGAAAAGADDAVHPALTQYSDALGIAFQIRDDLHDILDDAGAPRARGPRLSIVHALAYQYAAESVRGRVAAAWFGRDGPPPRDADRALVRTLGAEAKARQLLEHYRNEAIRSLAAVSDARLKVLLRRMINRILDHAPATDTPAPADRAP
jgi:geranylgeranyl pyrophosphate synthase